MRLEYARDSDYRPIGEVRRWMKKATVRMDE